MKNPTPATPSCDVKISKVSNDQLPPPSLPPKRGGGGGCRRNSDTPKILDTIHQRLLPKENCVTNILYSRRLPSPPVFRRKLPSAPATFARDDHFVEKPQNPYEEVDKRDLYCPLCNCNFGYSFGLECHFLSAHQDILKVAKNEEQFLQDVMISRSEWCPCCQAQFLTPGLVVKHLTTVHSEFILNFIDPESNSKNFNCRFCGQHFPKRHHKLLMLHIEQKHLGELEAMLLSSNRLSKPGELSNEVCLMLSLSKTVTFTASKSQPPPEPTTRKNMGRFGTLRSSLRRKKSSDVVSRQSLEDDKQYVTHEISVKYGDGNPNDVQPEPRPEVKKDLRFSIPDHHYDTIDTPESSKRFATKESTPFPESKRHRQFVPRTGRRLDFGPPEPLSTYRHVPQPEPPPPKSNKKSSISEEELESLSSTSSSVVSATSSNMLRNPETFFSIGRWTSRAEDERRKLYKCNLCELSFADNEILLGHLKNRHRSTMSKALKPHFSCGVCPAKFFKNSFLIKHCESHEKSR